MSSDTPGPPGPRPDLSVVVPVYDEEAALPELVARIAAMADGAGWTWELLAVLDGCSDGSRAALEASGRPEVRVLELDRNYGQHAAVYAGLEAARGRLVAMLDADLQNPPEAVVALAAELAQGADAAAAWRRGRRDPLWRRAASRAFNLLMSGALRAPGRDWGCMLRVYRREVVDAFLDSGEAPLFLPVQLARWTHRGVERPVDHAARSHGGSRYTPTRLARLFGRVVRARFAPPRRAAAAPPYRLAPPADA
jgi:undecaprenyl-phosphate 4-deoxy-4-formamido-L-arabinose transferase